MRTGTEICVDLDNRIHIKWFTGQRGYVEGYIAKYGYIGIFLGTVLEGETTVLLGGIFSRLGYMSLCTVMIYAFAGTLLGDCFFFSVGRFLGKGFIERFDFIRSKIPLANRVIKRYGNLIIFVIRFLVGIRAVVLILLGCTNLKTSKFITFSVLNSFVWTIAISFLGYMFGKFVFVFVEDIRRHEPIIVTVILACVVFFVFIYHYVVKKKETETYGDK